MDDECRHGLTFQTCSLCKHAKEELAKKQPDKVESVMRAQFEGYCKECDDKIIPGEFIARMMPSGRYVHWECV